MKLLFVIAAIALGISTGSAEFPAAPKKGLSGTYHPGQGLFDAEKEKTCRLDSADGGSLYLVSEHDNPLFESKAPNMVHLIMWWKTAPAAGVRYQLPHPEIEICYWEKGDLLMFHTFSAQGWLEFDKVADGKYTTGKLDMKLVRPHHNFSNSDYHYLGGSFKALNP